MKQGVSRILSQKLDYECVWFSAWKYRSKPTEVIWIYLYETIRRKALKMGYLRPNFQINENGNRMKINSLLSLALWNWSKIVFSEERGVERMSLSPKPLSAIPFLIGNPPMA